jgi:hypothetical protein
MYLVLNLTNFSSENSFCSFDDSFLLGPASTITSPRRDDVVEFDDKLFDVCSLLSTCNIYTKILPRDVMT